MTNKTKEKSYSSVTQIAHESTKLKKEKDDIQRAERIYRSLQLKYPKELGKNKKVNVSV